jgi:hypothetical protein
MGIDYLCNAAGRLQHLISKEKKTMHLTADKSKKAGLI